ncbi:MAG TPA: DUF305 domain-containing protein, partial [Longimicrobium sp.]|nr:DUF305 domain-containing protein [Longimicrobium sp.]
MKPKHFRALALVAALAAAGWRAAPAAAQGHTHSHGGSTVERPDTSRWTEADADFMSSMIGHHAQAIVMSRLAETHGASAAVQTLAARIINAQEDEIATMQRWLRIRGLPVPDAA